MASKIRKAHVPVGSRIVIMDVIEHDGKLWLVPYWLQHQTTKMLKPVRLIWLEALPHQVIDPPALGADFAVNSPIPEDVVEGRVQGQNAIDGTLFVTVEGPDFTVEPPPTTH